MKKTLKIASYPILLPAIFGLRLVPVWANNAEVMLLSENQPIQLACSDCNVPIPNNSLTANQMQHHLLYDEYRRQFNAIFVLNEDFIVWYLQMNSQDLLLNTAENNNEIQFAEVEDTVLADSVPASLTAAFLEDNPIPDQKKSVVYKAKFDQVLTSTTKISANIGRKEVSISQLLPYHLETTLSSRYNVGSINVNDLTDLSNLGSLKTVTFKVSYPAAGQYGAKQTNNFVGVPAWKKANTPRVKADNAVQKGLIPIEPRPLDVSRTLVLNTKLQGSQVITSDDLFAMNDNALTSVDYRFTQVSYVTYSQQLQTGGGNIPLDADGSVAIAPLNLVINQTSNHTANIQSIAPLPLLTITNVEDDEVKYFITVTAIAHQAAADDFVVSKEIVIDVVRYTDLKLPNPRATRKKPEKESTDILKPWRYFSD